MKIEDNTIRIGIRELQRGALVRSNVVTKACCGECGLQIGQCGCNGAVSYASAPDTGAPGGLGQYGLGGAGGFMATPGDGPPPCNPGCFPRSACDVRSGLFLYQSYSEQLRASRMRKMPYADPYYDSIHMDTIFSAVTTVGPGVSVDIPLFPTAGTFALFYYEIVAVEPLTQVQQVDWRAGQPRVEGCPVPCGTGDVEALSQFVMKVPEACCGTPLAAWLDRESENTPLVTPFTNNQAAGDLLVQIRGRGYCCNTRVC